MSLWITRKASPQHGSSLPVKSSSLTPGRETLHLEIHGHEIFYRSTRPRHPLRDCILPDCGTPHRDTHRGTLIEVNSVAPVHSSRSGDLYRGVIPCQGICPDQ